MPPVGGVDYSTKALDFAVVDGLKLIDAWEDALGVDFPNRLVTMAKAMRRFKDAGVETVYLEQPWFGGGQGGRAIVSNVNTLTLHRTAYHLEAVLIGNGLQVVFVPIATWRSVVLGNGRPKDPKAESIWYADAAFKYRTRNHNQADAICMAAYGAALQRSRVPNAQHVGASRRR